MKKMLLFLCAAVFLVAVALWFFGERKPANGAPTGATIAAAPNFKKMQGIADAFGEAGLAETLIVMDDDDTLTQMACYDGALPFACQYLGGSAWYNWQDSLVKNGIVSEYKVAETEGELLKIASLLLSINNMVFTDSDIPKILSTLTDQGAKTVVLTARGSSDLSATESQFNALPSSEQGESFLAFINVNALAGVNSGIASLAGPVTPEGCGANPPASYRPVSYRQGVMYVAGQNKGDMLKCLLAATQSEDIKNIVFLDDTYKNVEDVYNAFSTSKKYNVKALHYTKLSEHKNNFIDTKPGQEVTAYQAESQKRWQAIRQSLKTQLLSPAAE